MELKPENEASVINTDSSSRSSISELKKELMSLSELIKSTPAKVKSSAEVQNTWLNLSGGSVNWLGSDVVLSRIICKTPS